MLIVNSGLLYTSIVYTNVYFQDMYICKM